MSSSTAHKGQFVIELVPLIMIAALILLVFIVVITGRLSGVQVRGEQERLQQLAENLHTEITIAASVNNGYQRNFTLPPLVGTKVYTVGILKNTTIRVATTEYEASVVTFNVSGQPKIGNNMIRRNNGIITIN